MPKITDQHIEALEYFIERKQEPVLNAYWIARELLALLKSGEYVLVPREPTQKMLNAELDLRHWDNLPSYESRRDLRPHIYRAMLAAAEEEAP